MSQQTPPQSNNEQTNNPLTTPDSLESDLEALRTIFANEETSAPLGWPAVHAFESENDITLPEPYRTFVAEIADGCSSGPPEWGLLPLRLGEEQTLDDLATPFPLTKPWMFETDPTWPEGLEPGTSLRTGLVELGTEGCGMDWFLVVTGQQRGMVWQLSEHGAMQCTELGYPRSRAGFMGWVRDWAERRGWWDEEEGFAAGA
ncbi:hypothetical protein FQN55_008272 [Onygenales sp. PD_40]|nr:hypothetical protein FQN55_008272 [Onygenales sp. PD_40]KAK2785490.1 hypothetical protein FQN52_008401 [Onygenales sp. PD_12]KAK2791221.1 hypothetical protein FQN53_006059 [Emmonsiellopsis sp. PD_33]